MQYDLVFEGGGAKGFVFVGAMQAFEAAGHSFRRLIGTSAGAITATLLAAGYSAAGFQRVMNEKLPDGTPRFASFMDIPQQFEDNFIENSLIYQILGSINLPFIPERFEKQADRLLIRSLLEVPVFRNMFSFTERGGWFAGDAFINWFKEILDADGRHLAHTTLAQFRKLRPTTELTVIAADTTGNERLVLNHRTAPDCPVIWAVRMSMSIPFLWQEVVWLPQWGPYRGRDITGHTIVDGGLLSNFAVDLLVSQEPDIQEIMGTAVGDVNPLGFLIDEKVPVPNSVEPPRSFNPLENVLPKLDVKQLQTIRRITQLVDTLMGASDTYVIRSHRHCVCRLPAEGYGTTEFLMTDQRLNALVAAGHETMRLFLQGDKSVNAEEENDRA